MLSGTSQECELDMIDFFFFGHSLICTEQREVIKILYDIFHKEYELTYLGVTGLKQTLAEVPLLTFKYL